jgi:hypothetical protein
VVLSALRTAPPARTSSRPRHPAPTRSGLTRCHAVAARRSIGATSEGGEAEVPQRIGDLQDIVRTNRAGQGRFAEPPAADDPVARMQPSRTAAKA